MKLLKLLIVAMVVIYINCISVSAEELNKSQKERAEVIYSVVAGNYDEYGVLPSTCLVQAYIETNLGESVRASNNLWGICCGTISYSSLEEGTMSYMRVINNGYYDNAPFVKDSMLQLRYILDGGYCQPEGSYFNDAYWIMTHFNLTSYDERMWEEREIVEKKRLADKEHKIKLKEVRREAKLREAVDLLKSQCTMLEAMYRKPMIVLSLNHFKKDCKYICKIVFFRREEYGNSENAVI